MVVDAVVPLPAETGAEHGTGAGVPTPARGQDDALRRRDDVPAT
jgi:hypothetical protein